MDFLDIFEMIVFSSLTGSVIVVMILLIRKIFKHILNSTFHYYIWLILLIKLIIPFGPQTPLNISYIYENLHMHNITNENTEKIQINPSAQPENIDFGDSTPINSIQPSNKNVISPHINIRLNNKFHIEKVLFFIWILGVVLSIGILIAGYKKLNKIVRISIKNVTMKHKEILYNCKKIMHIRHEVELAYSQKVSSPSLCGLINPKILIPISVAANISDEYFKYIIMHELTHLKSKDIFINLVINLLSIIYWFNPILLYGFHKMRQDCELSCDDKVLYYLDEGENIQYGNALLRVLKLVNSHNKLIGTTAMIMNNSEIKRRIIMISKYKKINIKGMLLGAAVVIIISGLGIMLNTSKISSDKNIATNSTLQVQTPLDTSTNTVNNISNENLSTITKNSSSDNTNSLVPISSDIVIYNSHPNEDYPSGKKVTDVGALINDKLVNEGLKSSFLKCNIPIENYSQSYDITDKLVTETVKDYSNSMLLDIHRDEVTKDTKFHTRKIVLTLAKSNPHYEANKKFVDQLLTNIQNSKEVEKHVESEISTYTRGKLFFNQDLSNNSVLIELGNSASSDRDIQDCVNAIVLAVKNIQNEKL
jgi:bla regulator protein BlaR1